MNIIKQIKIASFITTLLFSLGGFVPTAEAFFFSTQKSDDNIFSAGKLEMVLSTNKVSDTNREARVKPSTGSAEFNYSVRAEVSSIDAFCTGIQVKVDEQSTVTLSELSLGKKRLEVEAEDVIKYEFILPSGITGSCEVRMTYEASQVGFNYGEAFFDEEVDVFTLSAPETAPETLQAKIIVEMLGLEDPAQVDGEGGGGGGSDPTPNNSLAILEEKKPEAAEPEIEKTGDKPSAPSEEASISGDDIPVSPVKSEGSPESGKQGS